MIQSPLAKFSQSVRIRACGVLVENDSILLVRHEGIGPAGFLWNPPGGGVVFQESVAQTVEREFLEETGLIVQTGEFLGFNEHIGDGLHALELFFSVTKLEGRLALGHDPELEGGKQMMTDIRFWSAEEINDLPKAWFHRMVPGFLA